MSKILKKQELLKRIKERNEKIKALQSLNYRDKNSLIGKFGITFQSRKETTKAEKVNSFIRLAFTSIELEKLDQKRGGFSKKEFLKYIINKYLF